MESEYSWEGDGIGLPTDLDSVTLKVSVVGPGGEELVRPRQVSFALSRGAHCEALESAAKKMDTKSAAIVVVDDIFDRWRRGSRVDSVSRSQSSSLKGWGS